MTAARKQALAVTAKALGLKVRKLDDGCYVLQEPGADGRRAIRIGPPDVRTHLLVGRSVSNHQMPHVQELLARFTLAEQVSRLLRATGANCVLDVGANVGQFAKRLRRARYEGPIHSFEPVSAAFAELEKAAADDPEWHVHNVALGSSNSQADINTSDRLSSLLPPSEFGRTWKDRMNTMGTETIQLRRLDSMFAELTAGLGDVRAFLKMDTQGFDLEVVRGAGAALDHVVCLQSEVACLPLYDGMPRLPEQLAEFEAAGFEIVGMFPVTHQASTLRAIEMDLLMVRADEVRKPRG